MEANMACLQANYVAETTQIAQENSLAVKATTGYNGSVKCLVLEGGAGEPVISA